MAKTTGIRAKVHLKENLEIELRDKNGNIKPLFQQNFLFRFLIKRGILSPNFHKIPVLLGFWRSKLDIANLITNAGMAGAASRLNGDGAEAAFTFIAIGTGTTAANVADTTLQTEIASGGGSRAAGTVSRVTTDVTNDTAQVEKTFTFTLTFSVTEAGLLNAASVGVLLARQVFTAIPVVSGDQLTIRFKVDVD